MPGLVRAPELSELETLVACAADGSLAAAGRRLGISRPAVAKRIAQLEAIVGSRLLEREAQGVTLTDAGAVLVARARRLLEERDALVEEILDLRADGGAPGSSGMRALVGAPTAAARVAQRPEAVFAATERLFELVFHASATAMVISDPDTGVVHVANDAFCRFTGRDRRDVVGRNAVESGTWYALEDRDRLVAEVRRHGIAAAMQVRTRRPDGGVRTGEATAQLTEIAGRPQLFTTVEDVTEQQAAERDVAAAATLARAVMRLGAHAAVGRAGDDLEAAALAALLEGGRFRTAAICDGVEGVVAHEGAPPARDLARAVERATPLAGASCVVRVESLARGAHDAAAGLGVRVGDTGRTLVALGDEPLSRRAEPLFAALLDDAGRILGDAAGRR